MPEFELKSWRFDQPYALDAASLGAHVATNLWLVESWSGYALLCTQKDSLLLTPAVADKRTNFAAGTGTLRLWFSPNWSSSSAGGSGPGDWATLFELQQTNEVKTPFALALSFSPDGDRLVLAVNNGQDTSTLIERPVSFKAGAWHQMALVYWKSGLALSVDDEPENITAKIPAWPDADTWNRSAFALGSSVDGAHPAQGQLDEVHTSAYPLSGDYLTQYYEFCAPVAALGPLPDGKGTAAKSANSGEGGGAALMMAGPGPCDPCPEGDGGGSTNSYVGGWTTNAGLKFMAMPILSLGTNYVARLTDTTPGKSYEIYQTFNLQGPSLWSRVATGAVNQTNFLLRVTSTNAVFLAASVEDQDLDGLSDAYERLVIGSTNTMWDTDGDGIPDGWEVRFGLNPTNRFDATNVDVNGISHLQRFLGEVTRLHPTEPLGPSSRRTPLVISEIMYHPATGQNEFIEIYNSHHLPQDLGGYAFYDPDFQSPVGRPYYTFESGTTIAPGGFLAVTPTNNLNNEGAKIQLRNRVGAVLLEVEYSPGAPWPKEADGPGHSLVLARPSYGENDPRAWAASVRRGGSPGTNEPNIFDPLDYIKINEFMANPGPTLPDYIELFNTSTQAVDIGGCVLSCTSNFTSGFVVPFGTILGPHGFRSWTDQSIANGGLGFSLTSAGEAIYFASPGTNRVIDAVAFGPQALGVSMGRYPDGAPGFQELSATNAGAANSPPLTRNLVINEIMYNPISGDDNDEFIEIYNRGSSTQSLSGWRLNGGVTFSFTSGSIAPSNYVVVARSPANLVTNYTNLIFGVNLFGGYGGTLKNSGERITLETNGIVMDEVTYGDGGRWGQWSDGGGSSLELIDPRSDNRLAANWADSLPPSSAPWTSLSVTGYVQTSVSSPGDLPIALELMMLGEGECLVDDVEVVVSTTNLVSTGTFDSGCLQVLTGNQWGTCTATNAATANHSCWFAQGTHEMSLIEATGGTTNGPCLRVRASGRGDYAANRIIHCWGGPIASNSVCTIRAKVKWLRGHPELVFRLRGGYLDAVAQMATTPGGTPGLPNSTLVTNAPPALWDVSHFPVVPAANEPVVVTARVRDPDGVTNLVLRYRRDTVSTNTPVPMRDDGLNGDAQANDGLFSAVVPGQSGGTVVAFTIEAADSLGATNRFPSPRPMFPGDTKERECVVHFGDGQPGGTFQTYRLWITAETYNQWASRNVWHNAPLDMTFVLNGNRAIYNAGAKYGGTLFSSGSYNTPTANLCGYALEFPSDDPLKGASGAGLDFQSAGTNYLQSEQLVMAMADRLELPNNHRRFIKLYVRGVDRTSTTAYEDTEQPSSDYLAKWFPDKSDGELFKLETWWQVADSPLPGWSIGQASAELTRQIRVSPSGSTNLDMAHYRLNWLPRAVNGSADEYGNFTNLVALVENPAVPTYYSNLALKIDDEQWMRTFGFERAVRNTDSYGFLAGHNMYAYNDLNNTGLKWNLLMVDFDGVFQYTFPTNRDPFAPTCCMDSKIRDMFFNPTLRRAMWRGLYDLANPTDGAMSTNFINPMFAGNVSVLAANGFTVPSASATNSDQTWLAERRDYLWGRLAEVRPALTILAPTNNTGYSSNTTSITMSGTAPVEVRGLKLNGVMAMVMWTTDTNWSLTAPLTTGTNHLQITGYDRKYNALPVRDVGGYTNQVMVRRN